MTSERLQLVAGHATGDPVALALYEVLRSGVDVAALCSFAKLAGTVLDVEITYLGDVWQARNGVITGPHDIGGRLTVTLDGVAHVAELALVKRILV